jgi:hypothetical protein
MDLHMSQGKTAPFREVAIFWIVELRRGGFSE